MLIQSTKIQCSLLVLALALTAALGPSLACGQAPTDEEAAKNTIWQKELAIYKGRGEGDLSIYLNSTSNQYVGWPPGAKIPADLLGLRKMAKSVSGLNQERLTMELADFTLSGDTAVIYYHTHRTTLPNGEPTDQRYAICHVWVREQGEWRLIGAHGRLKSANELRVSAAPSQ
jgi:hypothetical protein